MNEILRIAIAFGFGFLLGTFFFGGLWWTVRRGVNSAAPALWFLGSLMLRMSVVVGGFYLISRGGWRCLLSCLLGFSIARIALMQVGANPQVTATSLTAKVAP